jgi:polysaccharide deacetylase family protein (PEP-CTERM system associated)
MLAILSFDIEDWFHILDNPSTRSETEWPGFESRIERNVDRILEALDDSRQEATFFCLGWVARKHPELLRRIASLGYEIACHSDTHQLVYHLGPAGFRRDLEKGIASIEDIIGRKVVVYRAPGFSVTASEAPWFFEALGEQGIEVDCSVFVGRHGHGGIPKFPVTTPCKVNWSGGTIKEFPMSAATVLGKRVVYSGGGYFRLMPIQAIRWLASRQDYMMTYFHPRDFDPEQPVVPGLSYIRRVKSYYGLDSSLPKLRRLIDEMKFVDVRTAVRAIDWSAVTEVSFAPDGREKP